MPFRTADERRLLGVCQLANKRLAPFNGGDEATLNSLLRCAAFQIENWRMRDALSRAGTSEAPSAQYE